MLVCPIYFLKRYILQPFLLHPHHLTPDELTASYPPPSPPFLILTHPPPMDHPLQFNSLRSKKTFRGTIFFQKAGGLESWEEVVTRLRKHPAGK
ncbi:hypothetical protein CDAR_185331 [Caerostris darwini]|uniref:Uncharacterized protein n=1 Tax=Caerostris darwini TaxID=1538125 RepID=A0AAV4SNY2_9ARAC|nr:hypothetical protein CDAR_185331 [Caerostris darwini]